MGIVFGIRRHKFWGIFSATNDDILPQKLKCSVKNTLNLAVMWGHFGPVDGRKNVFCTFSKLFKSCLGSVLTLFLSLEDLLLGVFSASKVDI